MPRTRYLLSMVMLSVVTLLCAPRAMAQPLFHVEHNWTVIIHGHRYGLWRVVQTPGDRRWTEIWVADCSFRSDHRTAKFVTRIAIVGVTLCCFAVSILDSKSRRSSGMNSAVSKRAEGKTEG
jgi:hypothetical protein